MAWPAARPSPAGHPNVFLAGDWVGPEGFLADAAAASARSSARQVLLAGNGTEMKRGAGHAHKLIRLSRNTDKRLLAAYRMLGSQSDADDVMQEAYLRWTK